MKFSKDQEQQIRYGELEHLDVSLYSNPDLSVDQMRAIRLCLALNIDVTGLNLPEVHPNEIYRHINSVTIERFRNIPYF